MSVEHHFLIFVVVYRYFYDLPRMAQCCTSPKIP